jgi:glycosyltransferase involved in cell wall biosynthesis
MNLNSGKVMSLEKRADMTDPNSAPDLSVVLPVYNNRDSIEPLYSRLRDTLESANITFELIFVDDRCPQRSYEIVDSLVKHDSRVNLLLMRRNVGQNNVLLTGFSHSTGKLIAAMDADLQDPPEALPKLVAELNKGNDVVFAGRAGIYESRNRLFTSRIYKTLMHVFSGVPSDAGLFFVSRKEVIERILSLNTGHSPILPLIGVSGAKTTSIPITRLIRSTGVSSYSGIHRLKLGLTALFWVISYRLRLVKSRGFISDVPVEKKSGKLFTSLES